MLFNIEIAQSFSQEKKVPEAFYKSMSNSFEEVVQFVSINGLLHDYKDRIVNVYKTVQEQN